MTTVADALSAFDYHQAFIRNTGWLTRAEQDLLRRKRVAIAGLGGVGGAHLLTLIRLGIGAFTLAEADVFELPNFNRQLGAGMSTVGRAKLDVLSAIARDVNPELDIRELNDGVKKENVAELLRDVDLYVDGLDFFAFEARRLVFSECARREIPAVTVAPLGMGAALLNFLPGGMTFEEYFRWEGCSEHEMALRFLVGLSPAALHRTYLAEPKAVDLASGRGPSTAMACQLCAGIAASEALKILLGRGEVIAAPRGVHLDAYRNRLVHTWRPFGNRNPIQRLMLGLARRHFGRPVQQAASVQLSAVTDPNPVMEILDLARWAPSGDNSQPWRFEILRDSHVVVHGFDTRGWCVYDLDGRASQLAIGALLETIRIAATSKGLRSDVTRRTHCPEERPTFDVRLAADTAVRPSTLVACIKRRSVQRRPLRMRGLTPEEKGVLEASVAPDYRVVWLESWRERLAFARITSANAKIRLSIPEGFDVHRRVIEWGAKFSEDRIPDRAVGLDPITLRLMRWVLQDWRRVQFLNTFLAGTLTPRMQLELIPGLLCATHYLLVAPVAPVSVDDFVKAGGAVQRFWLTATDLGLQQQPEMTPLIFGRYARDGRTFSTTAAAVKEAGGIAARVEKLLGKDVAVRAVWMGRLGHGKQARARSLRLPLDALLLRS